MSHHDDQDCSCISVQKGFVRSWYNTCLLIIKSMYLYILFFMKTLECTIKGLVNFLKLQKKNCMGILDLWFSQILKSKIVWCYLLHMLYTHKLVHSNYHIQEMPSSVKHIFYLKKCLSWNSLVPRHAKSCPSTRFWPDTCLPTPSHACLPKLFQAFPGLPKPAQPLC